MGLKMIVERPITKTSPGKFHEACVPKTSPSFTPVGRVTAVSSRGIRPVTVVSSPRTPRGVRVTARGSTRSRPGWFTAATSNAGRLRHRGAVTAVSKQAPRGFTFGKPKPGDARGFSSPVTVVSKRSASSKRSQLGARGFTSGKPKSGEPRGFSAVTSPVELSANLGEPQGGGWFSSQRLHADLGERQADRANGKTVCTCQNGTPETANCKYGGKACASCNAGYQLHTIVESPVTKTSPGKVHEACVSKTSPSVTPVGRATAVSSLRTPRGVRVTARRSRPAIPNHAGWFTARRFSSINLSQRRRRHVRATQSSTSIGGRAERAIDGNTNTRWSQKSCTHTRHDNHPWWRVDLTKEVQVRTVTVWNRGDCCGARLNGFQVRVGNHGTWGRNPRCGSSQALRQGYRVGQGKSKTVSCQDRRGRYVFVVIPRREYLSLCEVTVVGAQPPPTKPHAKSHKKIQSTARHTADVISRSHK